MPPLHRVLADHDLGLLRLIAERWGLELTAGSQREAADELAGRMLAPELAAEIIAALPPEPRAGFDQLARDGRQLLASFTRRYGELRAMGPARRDRERPWANTPSATEALWYRGLIGRAFFDGGRGPEEFVFIPDDLRSLAYVAEAAAAAARPAPPGQPAPAPNPLPQADPDAAGDDAVTLLAYLQVVPVRLEAGAPGGGPTSGSPGAASAAKSASTLPAQHRAALARFLRQPAATDLLLSLLRQIGLAADPGGGEPARLDPERVQPFLQAGAPERARRLAEAWRDARDWNDLLRMPGLVFEGQGWRNDPAAARQAILQLLALVPPGEWWSLDSFVAAVKERQPDFQRPAGDYDSWYIRDAASGAFLRGFANWDRVEGALVRWLIEQPLRWLGAVEVAGAAFRLSAHGAALLGLAGWPEPADPPALELAATGLVRARPGASGYDRFQLARISDWLPPEPGSAPPGLYAYQLTPGSLARAARKGIAPSRVAAFLERAAAGQPGLPALARALRRWEQQGTEASVREAVVLRLASPELLEKLRQTPGVGERLGESLGPAAVEVRRADLDALRAALWEQGIWLESAGA